MTPILWKRHTEEKIKGSYEMSSVLNSDPNWIRIRWPTGFESIFEKTNPDLGPSNYSKVLFFPQG